MKKAMPDEPPIAVGLAAGAVSRLANEFKVGDFIITPEPGDSLLLGEVSGQYRFDDAPLAEDLRHVRPVRWFARVGRSQLSEGLRKSLGSIMTLFLPGFQDELLAVI